MTVSGGWQGGIAGAMIAVAGAGAFAQAPAVVSKPTTTLTPLHNLDKWGTGERVKVFSASMDGQHLLALVPSGLRYQLMRDGEPVGDRLDDCQILKAAPDFFRLAFVRSDDNMDVVLVNGGSAERYPFQSAERWWSREHPALSPDIHHLVVWKNAPGGNGLLVRLAPDGAELGPFSDVSDEVQFSADGKHFAFVADGELLVDGKSVGTVMPGQENTFALSPDGTHEAWVKGTPTAVCMVLDGNICGPALGDVDAVKFRELVFSADSKRFAFVINGKDRQRVIIDGKQEVDSYDDVERLCFSDDGAGVAYWAQRNGNVAVIANGETGPVFSGGLGAEGSGAGIAFPEASHIAYALNSTLVVDGRKMAMEGNADELETLAFTPARGHVVATSKRNVLVDGAAVGYAPSSLAAIHDEYHVSYVTHVESGDKKTAGGWYRVDVTIQDKKPALYDMRRPH